MTDTTVNETAIDAGNVDVSEISDEQALQYFEHGGELPEEQGQESTEQTQEPSPEQPQAPKMVRLEALHEARAQLKEQKEQNQRMERVFQQVMQMMTQRQQEPQEQVPEIPALEADPVGHFRAKTELLERQLQQLTGQFGQVNQQISQNSEYVQLAGIAAAAQQEFARQKPDYYDAYNHVREHRLWELQTIFGHDPATANQIIKDDEAHIVRLAIQNGRNPAELVYEIAQKRGYAPKQTQQPEQRLETLQRGVQASKRVDGQAPASTSLAKLSQMSDADIAANWDKIKKGEF